MNKSLKDLFEEYNSLPKSTRRTRLGKKIRKEKKKLIEERNYVDIVYILRFMGDYEKDRFFMDLLESNPDSSLFILAFAGSEMNSYSRAYRINFGGEDDEETLENDIELTLDRILCEFLSKHNTEEDFNYVKILTDGANWLESNKKSLKRTIGTIHGNCEFFLRFLFG